MPNKYELIDQVASQMMRCGQPGRLKASDKEKERFRKRHEKHIIWALKSLPRSSSALAAVIVKCLIKYDDKKVAEFCNALKNQIFDGPNDPAFLLWRFIQVPHGKETMHVYKISVCAAKAYMEGRKIKNLRPVKEDVFKWDDDWTVPDDLMKDWNPKITPDELLTEC